MTTYQVGGRTPYNLAWQDATGQLRFTQMRVLGPADPWKAVTAVRDDYDLSDWCAIRSTDKPVLVAREGAVYPLTGRRV